MNEKAMGYIIAFSFMIIMALMFNQWLIFRAYKSAGVTFQQVTEHWHELKGSFNRPLKTAQWLEDISPERARTRRLLHGYILTAAPALIFLLISIIGLFTHAFDKLLDYGIFAVIFLNMALTICGSISRPSH